MTYLSLILYMGIYIYRNHNCNKVHMAYGSMGLTLAIAEVLYIIPRTYAILTTGLEDNLFILGWGRIGHMVAMTIFFSMLVDLNKECFGLRKKVPLDKLLYGLLVFRVVIGIFPQNGHFQLEPDRTFILIRTIPLMVYLLVVAMVMVTCSISGKGKGRIPFSILIVMTGFLVEPELFQSQSYWQLVLKVALRGLLFLAIIFTGFREVRKANELSRF